MDIAYKDVEENSSVKQVALTVPVTDDPSIPVLTFRMWFLGILSCVLLSFLNQFFNYRKEPLSISSLSAQIAVVPLGQLMARYITPRIFFEGTRYEFTLNPGPFNMKEHVLITIFANSGAGSVYAIHIVNTVKVFYRKSISFPIALIVILTTQLLGFGWAGIFRRFLVEPAAMWWPSNLVQVNLFVALHEKEKREKGRLTRTQFFLIVLMSNFAYYIFPGYLFPHLTSLSWVCWVFPKSVLAHQLGSGMSGIGLGAISLDWLATAYLSSPLASPWFATANMAVGFGVILYIITPISYWLNFYNAKNFPIFSQGLFTSSGKDYDISSIINIDFQIDIPAYEKSGPLQLSTFFAMYYGVGFATLSATLVHVALFHGREILEETKSAFKEKKMDIHTRLMSKYKQVPEWWFLCILLATAATTIFSCEYYKTQLQLPWWGVLLTCGIAFFFTLPIGIITATTNQTYGYISMTQALTFLQDFKLGHYMKIPPRTMFMAQVVGTVVAAFAYLGTACPWTCPQDHVFYDASVIWGLIGPRRIFGDLGTYKAINWFFLAGAIAPVLVWLAHKAFPTKKWISLIHMPVLIGATASMPPATAINFTSFITIGFLSGFVVYRYRQDWWRRHNYLLSGALDAGLAFMRVALYFLLNIHGISLNWWGSNLDGCPLASCPTAKGIRVEGCPLF
ncbi:hypothetical protein MKW98_026078 [Papaver atlanticum]|uniref:Uncharacterized protein n=1 Tax=Papaver atlanticum TaxID=357466 RepID=A0AAD4RY00_9MAGN|nr:hypothetical protein MKW98_026078 [Papaver atlanticum]